MSIYVTPDLVTFENVEGDRRTIKLEDLFASLGASEDEGYHEAEVEQRSGLLLWGCFYQLVEISQNVRQLNERIGHLDVEKAEGTGVAGLAGQQAVSLLECSQHLGKLVDLFETIEKRSQAGAQPLDTAKIMAEAGQVMTGMMKEAQRPPGSPIATPVPSSNDGS